MGGECCVVRQKQSNQPEIQFLQGNKRQRTLDFNNQIVREHNNIRQDWIMAFKCLKELSFDSGFVIEKLKQYFQLQQLPQIAQAIAQLYFEIKMQEQGRQWLNLSIEKYKCIQSPQRSLTFYEQLAEIQPKSTYCGFGYIKFVTSPQFEYNLPQNGCQKYIQRLKSLLGSESFVLFHLRGKILKKKRQFSEAIKMYAKSIKLNKYFWQSYQDLASIYFQTQYFSYALQVVYSYRGQLSHSIRGVIAEFDFKTKMNKLSEYMIDQLVKQDALGKKIIPFVVQSFGYRGKPEMMIDYANQHEGQKDFVPICYFLAETFLKTGDSVNAVIYLRLIRQNCRQIYSVSNNIKLARQCIKNGDTSQSNKIIEEIQKVWQDLNAKFLTKFTLLLFQAQKHERVIKIYQSKLKYCVQELAPDLRMELFYILGISSQKVETKLTKTFEKQFKLSLNKCTFLTTQQFLQASYFYKKRKSTKKARFFFSFFMKEIKRKVFYGHFWEKKMYEKHFKMLKNE